MSWADDQNQEDPVEYEYWEDDYYTDEEFTQHWYGHDAYKYMKGGEEKKRWKIFVRFLNNRSGEEGNNMEWGLRDDPFETALRDIFS